LKGIRTLHRNKIFHCDLKPQNVFFRDAQQQNLVIGDYGSAKTFGFENGKDIRKTSIVKGTDFYLPPEQARGFISEKNDYYSFGMILLHLIYPEKVCQSNNFLRLSRQKLKQIIENQFEGKPIIEFDESKGKINALIAGLTLSNVKNRWGESEIRSWLSGEVPKVRYGIGANFSEQKLIQPIDLGDRIIRTETDLVNFIENDSEWYELLIEDQTGRYLFNKWLDSVRTTEEQEELDYLIKKYQQYGIEFIREAVLRFFQPYRPIIFKNWAFDFMLAEDLKFETIRYFGRLINENLSEKALNLHIFKYELVLQNCQGHSKTSDIWQIFHHYYSKLNGYYIFSIKNIKEQVEAIFWRLIGEKMSDFSIFFQEINHKGIHCQTIKTSERYFKEQNEDWFVSEEQNHVLKLLSYPVQEDFEGDIHFTVKEIYDFTISKIKTLLNLDESWDWYDFENFRDEIQKRNPIIWKKTISSYGITVSLIEMRKNGWEVITCNIENYSNEEADYKIHYQVDFPNVFLSFRPIPVDTLIENSEQILHFKKINRKKIVEEIHQRLKLDFGEDVEFQVISGSPQLTKSLLPESKRNMTNPNIQETSLENEDEFSPLLQLMIIIVLIYLISIIF